MRITREDALGVVLPSEPRLARRSRALAGPIPPCANIERSPNCAPLLFISGSEDHLMPPAVQRSNAKHYKSNTITEIREFPGRSHLMPGQQGWEEIADYALTWAKEHAMHQPQAAPTSS